MIFVFQGLDFTDQGYWLTGYQLIFADPQAISVMMATWLSLVIGGLVNLTGLGVISFRIAFVVVTWVTIWLSYRLLRECFSRRELLFPLFVTLVYITEWGVNWVSYNDLSAMFFLATTLALWLGLQGENSKWILLAGLVLGLGVYLRLPNVAGLALVAAIVFAGWLYGWRFGQCATFAGWFFLGVASGLLIGLLAMKLLGHLPYFLGNFQALLHKSAQQSYHHSSQTLVNLFIIDHKLVFKHLLLVLGVIVATALVQHLEIINKMRKAVSCSSVVTVLGIGVVFSLAIWLGQDFRYRWALPGFCYAVLAAGMIRECRGGSRSHALLCLIALILLVTVPLGSSNGIGNAIYGSWLALPVALLMLGRLPQSPAVRRAGVDVPLAVGSGLPPHAGARISTVGCENEPPRLPFTLGGGSKIMAWAVLLFSLHLAYTSTYRDSRDRTALRYGLAAPGMAGIFTTAARAKVVDELLAELAGVVRPGDQLLAVTDIPLLHYLTRTRPYLSSPWPALISQELLADRLREITEKGQALPVVVRTKGSVLDPEWPNVPIDPAYTGDGEALIREFMVTSHYLKRWENQWFEIWAAN